MFQIASDRIYRVIHKPVRRLRTEMDRAYYDKTGRLPVSTRLVRVTKKHLTPAQMQIAKETLGLTEPTPHA
jgi:hypothetical protein